MIVQLSSQGWHVRLQQFVLGSYFRTYQNFCPFFWTTVFCVLASPFSLLAKGVGLGLNALRSLASKVDDRIDDVIFMPLMAALTRLKVGRLDEAAIYRLLLITKNENSVPWSVADRARELLEVWKFLNPCWAEKLYNISAKFEKMDLDWSSFWPKYRDFSELKAIASKALVGVYGTALTGIFVAAGMKVGWLTVLGLMGGIGTLLGAIFGVILLVCELKERGRLDGVERVISTPFAFIASYIRSVKQNHCPAIDWVD